MNSLELTELSNTNKFSFWVSPGSNTLIPMNDPTEDTRMFCGEERIILLR